MPVGVPVPGEAGITTAVKTTVWSKTDPWGAEENSNGLVLSCLTVWVKAVDVLGAKWLSPP